MWEPERVCAPFRRNPVVTVLGALGKAGVPGLLLLLGDIVMAFATRRRDPGSYAQVDIASMTMGLYVVLCFGYCVGLLRRPIGGDILAVLLRRPLIYLLLYVLLCLVSTLWSPQPIYTVFRAFECLTYLMLITAVCIHLKCMGDAQDMVDWLVLWSAWVVFWKARATVQLWGGWQSVPPGAVFRAGSLAAGVFVVLALFSSRRRLAGVVLFIFALLSGANKTYVGLACALLPALVHGSRKAKEAAPFLLGVVVLAYLVFGTALVQNTVFHGREGIGWDYMSGRRDFWLHALEVGMEKPGLGYGFVSGEREVLNAIGRGYTISAHNAFLSALLSVGVAGPILITLSFGSLVLAARKAELPSHVRSGIMGTIVMAFCISISAPGLGGRVYGSWVATVLVFVSVSVLFTWPQRFAHDLELWRSAHIDEYHLDNSQLS
jgi:hypothetical protein